MRIPCQAAAEGASSAPLNFSGGIPTLRAFAARSPTASGRARRPPHAPSASSPLPRGTWRAGALGAQEARASRQAGHVRTLTHRAFRRHCGAGPAPLVTVRRTPACLPSRGSRDFLHFSPL